MKKIVVISLSLILIGMSTTLKSQEMTQEQKVSYALGNNVGRDFQSNNIAIDNEAFMQGFTDAYAGKNKFTQQELQQIFEQLNQQLQAEQMKSVEIEKTRGTEFLAENKKKEGVVETGSGLQYKVVTMGTGVKPTATDQVKVHYHGTTIDGTVFDSSVERGEPITFGLNQVIKGWTEGVQLMPVGSKFIFYIPSHLAYGDQGAGAIIKPGAMLIFEVELLDVNPSN